MRKVGRAAPVLLVIVQAQAFAAGVTPYLPLNLQPEIELPLRDW